MTNKTFDLTDGELRVAHILIAECLAGMGGKRPSDLEYDEYTWAYPADLVKGWGYSKNEAAGFFSSLWDKGFLECWDDTDVFNKKIKVWVVSTQAWKWLDTKWDDLGGWPTN